ncbi:MAG: 3-phosphoshikimate 1-carboxyvinyltransferase [Negativicutes bacterium]|nr:3-phosphoshikimate 1-carboxyvinyltransferase [Negativicutes bacterium]
MSKRVTVRPGRALRGEVFIPGDKSISHRAVMLAGLAQKPVIIRNFLLAADCCSTLECMRALGVTIVSQPDGDIVITGNGLRGLKEPNAVLDAGNSGTTMRLMSGILGGQSFFSIMTGDNSLRHRPMGRVIQPLSQMGCRIKGRQQDKYAPLAILPAERIKGISYASPVASAQIKSAVLLAGLYAEEPTSVSEPVKSRDHTELMLQAFGVDIRQEGTTVTIYPGKELDPPDVLEVPGDISSAAFWLVAATIVPGSELYLRNVGVNPTRTGILDVLRAMGANITVVNRRESAGELVADLVVKSADLVGTSIGADIMPRLIDEIPVLAVAALAAKGKTVIAGAEELRVKETDRLKAIAQEFARLGAAIIETPDGLIINGPQKLGYGDCYSHDDHRIAMSLAVAGVTGGGASISDPGCVAISYPRFFEELNRLTNCVEALDHDPETDNCD